MNLLAFDTTGERLSLAVSVDGRVKVRFAKPDAAQDEQVPGETKRLLASVKLGLKQVDAFAAPTGPGRFTGIRVGLTFAAVLGKSLGKPVAGVSWLEACAWRLKPEAGTVVAVVPGWKGEFYFQAFVPGEGGPRPKGEPRWADPAGLARAVEETLGGQEASLVGPGAAAAGALLPRLACRPGPDRPLDASDLLEPAKAKLAAGEGGEPAPLYIKPPHYER